MSLPSRYLDYPYDALLAKRSGYKDMGWYRHRVDRNWATASSTSSRIIQYDSFLLQFGGDEVVHRAIASYPL